MENNTIARLGAKQSNNQLMTSFNSVFNNAVQATDSLPCLTVSIAVAENTANNNIIPSFLIKVSDQQQDTAIAISEVTITLVYTATAVNGNDYTGKSTIIIAAGTNTKDFAVLDKIELEEDVVEEIVISITEVKSTGSEQVVIDELNYCSKVDIAEHPLAYFNIEEVSVDVKAGIVEFDVSLSGDVLTCDASVDYIIGDAIAFDNGPTILPSGTLIFNPGITSHTVTIPIADDALEGYYGLFNVALTHAVNAIIVDKSKIYSSTKTSDTDLDSAFVSIAASTLAVNEGNAAAFKVELRDSNGHLNTALADVTVDILYSATSKDNTDFVGVEKVVIPANSSSIDFEITALDEYITETVETINIELIQVTGGRFKSIALDYSQLSVDVSILEEC